MDDQKEREFVLIVNPDVNYILQKANRENPIQPETLLDVFLITVTNRDLGINISEAHYEMLCAYIIQEMAALDKWQDARKTYKSEVAFINAFKQHQLRILTAYKQLTLGIHKTYTRIEPDYYLPTSPN